MKLFRRLPGLPAGWLVLLSCLADGTLPAQTADQWTNSTSGLWTAATNWSAALPPGSSFSSIQITNANTKTITIDASTPSANLSVQRLSVAAPAGSTNTLALVGLATNTPLRVTVPLTVGAQGVLAITNSALTASGFFGSFDIVASSAVVAGGLLDCSTLTSTRLGRTNNGVAQLTVAAGQVLLSQVELGAVTGSEGVLDVEGGAVNASALITAGFTTGSTGLVSVAAGQLVATNDVTYIGNGGMGGLSVSGGSASFAFLRVGNNADGSALVTGGQLMVLPRSTNDWAQVGNLGNGVFSMSGGTVLLRAELHLGDDLTGSGNAILMGGQLIATNEITAIGRYGPGQMTISNAVAQLANVSVGRHDGSTGTLTIQDGAQVFMVDGLSIGRFSNSVGHVSMAGGFLSLTNDTIWVGREGSGDLTVSGGVVQATSLAVAQSTVTADPNTGLPMTNQPAGLLTLAGGAVLLSSNLVVGTDSLSTGLVSVVGGTLTVTNGVSGASLDIGNGTFTLTKGAVTVDSLVLTNGPGQLSFNGGTLQAKNIVAANGSAFVVGDGTSAATLQLQGGICTFANGLVISSNATLTGCATIIGPVTNYGTISTNCSAAGPLITSTTRTGATVSISYTTVTGPTYILEYKDTLGDAHWTAILPGVLGNGSVMTQADASAAVPSRFYRIRAQ